jgi:hypothetical protein
MDEKGFMMGMANKCKVICRRNRNNPHLTHDVSYEWVTVIEGVSAPGKVLLPMVINKGEAHYKGWYANLKCHDIVTFGYLSKGWSDRELGIKWLVDNVQKYSKINIFSQFLKH